MRSVVIDTGARWRDMNVPGETEYRTRGVTYCPHCDGPLFKGKRVAVIGGGNSGVEAAIDLPGVFAAGDVTTVPYMQIIIAAGEGAKAVLGAFDHLIRSSAPAEAA